MRIGTWNVEYAWPSRLKALREVLSANLADIWILTETHDDLSPPNCDHVAHSAPRPRNWSGVRPGSRWVSIWSRFPIIARAQHLSDTARTVSALLDIGRDRTVLVYGTVMPWKGDRGIDGWSEHHRVIPEQCAEWLQLSHSPRRRRSLHRRRRLTTLRYRRLGTCERQLRRLGRPQRGVCPTTAGSWLKSESLSVDKASASRGCHRVGRARTDRCI
jgi:hypothetical protein